MIETLKVDKQYPEATVGALASGTPGLGNRTRPFLEMESRGVVAKSGPSQPKLTQATVVWSTAWAMPEQGQSGLAEVPRSRRTVRLILTVRVDDFCATLISP